MFCSRLHRARMKMKMDTAYSWLRRGVSKLKTTSLPSLTSTTNTTTTNNNNNKTSTSSKISDGQAEQLYGVTEQLVEFIKSFSLETFKNISLPDEEVSDGGDGGKNSRSVRQDLSDWQETHAILVLSKVKELAQLRFQLCPRHLKERQFWRIYFTLVKSYVKEYELRAVRLAKLKQMENETVSDSVPCEVEMSEAKFSSMDSETPGE